MYGYHMSKNSRIHGETIRARKSLVDQSLLLDLTIIQSPLRSVDPDHRQIEDPGILAEEPLQMTSIDTRINPALLRTEALVMIAIKDIVMNIVEKSRLAIDSVLNQLE